MTSTDEKKYLLSDLYPYDIAGRKNADLRKGLREYNFFLKALAEASHHFQAGNLERFDALVGENACQIRAIKIAILASKGDAGFSLLDPQIKIAREKISALFDDQKLSGVKDPATTIFAILQEYDLEISLNRQQLFLFQSYLLCKAKEEIRPDGDCSFVACKDKQAPLKWKEICPSISSNFVSKLVNNTRKSLATLSVEYLRNIATDFNDPWLITMLSEKHTLEHNNLPCTPTFWTFKTLLKKAYKESIPITLHIQFLSKIQECHTVVDEELFCYTVDENGITRYVETNAGDIDTNQPVCVIQGTVFLPTEPSIFNKESWKKRLNNHSLDDLLLSFAAVHRQYPNPDFKGQFSCDEYFEYQRKGHSSGTSIEDPNFLLFYHIFPMMAGKTPNLISPILSC